MKRRLRTIVSRWVTLKGKRNAGEGCPLCGEDNGEVYERDYKGLNMIVRYRCEWCGADYRKTFELKKIEVLKEIKEDEDCVGEE